MKIGASEKELKRMKNHGEIAVEAGERLRKLAARLCVNPGDKLVSGIGRMV